MTRILDRDMPVPMAAPSSLSAGVRIALGQLADPERAPAMQAYMKSAMPYLGVTSVPLRLACRALFAGLSWASAADWQKDVLALWDGALYREERYAAIELTGVRAARPFQDLAALGLYEQLIVSGAWWDYVDNIATQRLWPILQLERKGMAQAMRAWSMDADTWKRRSAILCQIKAGAETDIGLLYDCIEPSLASREFFLRKAIGWALRQLARTHPAEVRRYVRDNEGRLSVLSRREALKRIGYGTDGVR